MIWSNCVQVNKSSGIQIRDQDPESTFLFKKVHVHHEADCKSNYLHNHHFPHHQTHHEYVPQYMPPPHFVQQPQLVHPEPEPQPLVYDYGSYAEPIDGRGSGLTISLNNIRLPKIDLRRVLNRMPRITVSFSFD